MFQVLEATGAGHPGNRKLRTQGCVEVRLAHCAADGTTSQELSGQKLRMLSVSGFLYQTATETPHEEPPRLQKSPPEVTCWSERLLPTTSCTRTEPLGELSRR